MQKLLRNRQFLKINQSSYSE
ncbi:hypothetical protein [Plasmodium yoelii yoelii]|uniref:Uncharacterized protein n=1 Tax=Plasmodium yoelii yoelii TaxID=73239 RepID=Q7R8Z7_PLAYO|nr:hypothetical protein [Plasmodium yoelii yoelii]